MGGKTPSSALISSSFFRDKYINYYYHLFIRLFLIHIHYFSVFVSCVSPLWRALSPRTPILNRRREKASKKDFKINLKKSKWITRLGRYPYCLIAVEYRTTRYSAAIKSHIRQFYFFSPFNIYIYIYIYIYLLLLLRVTPLKLFKQ
eukprot:gene1617-987_t